MCCFCTNIMHLILWLFLKCVQNFLYKTQSAEDESFKYCGVFHNTGKNTKRVIIGLLSVCTRGLPATEVLLCHWSHSNRPMDCLITSMWCFEPLLSHMARNQCLKTLSQLSQRLALAQPGILTLWSSWQTQWTKNNLWYCTLSSHVSHWCMSDKITSIYFFRTFIQVRLIQAPCICKIRKLSGNILSCWLDRSDRSSLC